jgi:hypothetical protein
MSNRALADQKYRDVHKEERNAKARSAYAVDKESTLLRSRAYYKSHRDEVLKRCRRNNYGENAQEHFEARLVLQGDCCDICRKPFISTKGTHQDHCHATGQLRSVLCTHCNKGLSGFLDSPELLRIAAKYLEDWAHDERATSGMGDKTP